MKHFIKLLMIFILITFMFSSCTVNEVTGLIKIENFTDQDLTNVKIGNTLLAIKVPSGGYFDYWYFNELKGNITSDSIKTNDTQSSVRYDLKPDFWTYVEANQRQGGQNSTTYQLEINVTKQGTEEASIGDYTY